MPPFSDGGIGFQPVKFYRSCLRFAELQCVHRLEAYATFYVGVVPSVIQHGREHDIGFERSSL